MTNAQVALIAASNDKGDAGLVLQRAYVFLDWLKEQDQKAEGALR